MRKLTLKKRVTDYLEKEPKFRERKNKDLGLLHLVARKHPLLSNLITSREISQDTMVAILQDYASMDRVWRKTLKDNEELRGSDYDQKDILEQEKMIELGYEVGFDQDVKLKDKLND